MSTTPLARSAAILLLPIAIAACHDKQPAAPTPAPQPVSVTLVTVAGPTTLQVGSAAQFTAKASMSDGTIVDVTSASQWSTLDAALLSVGAGGAVMPTGKGPARVQAIYQGRSGITAVQVQLVLVDTLNDDTQTTTGEPSFHRYYTTYNGNEAYDDFLSPVATQISKVTWQGIRCGSGYAQFYFRWDSGGADLPNTLVNATGGYTESSLIKSIDGTVPNACPGGKPGTLVTYVLNTSRDLLANRRYWISIWAYYPDYDWYTTDQWLFRHGKPHNNYAASLRDNGQTVRQSRDLALRIE